MSEGIEVAKKLPVTDDIREAMATIRRGTDSFLIEEEFEQKLARSKATGKPLRCKLGLDPTAPDIHIGHTVVLNKLRQLQDLGHQVIFLVGDFTAAIGDPSGRNVTRPPLSRDRSRRTPKPISRRPATCSISTRPKSATTPNGPTPSAPWASSSSPPAIRSRVFSNAKTSPSATPKSSRSPCTSFSIPSCRATTRWRSKPTRTGGSDQRFNLLVGRELQRQYGQEPQCILTMPLLVGLDGQVKMSKSKHNYIGITDEPNDMFGKVMSISDTLMWDWYDLLSLRPNDEIAALKKECAEGRNPRDAKVMLAKEIVARFHSAAAADGAEAEFVNRFRQGAMPSEIPEVTVPAGEEGIQIARMLKEAGLVSSTSDGNRMIEQGGVRIQGEGVSDKTLRFKAGEELIVQVGKRKWAKIHLA